MRYFRDVLPALAGIALAALLAGCGGKSNPPKQEADNGKSTSDGPKPAPKRNLKAAKDLKVPDKLDDAVTELKMARSGWLTYEDSRVGDVGEYEFPGANMRSRTEVFDLADHAVVTLTEVTMEIEGKKTTTRGAMRVLFTEDEPSAEPKDDKLTYTRRPANRKFEIEGREVVADVVNESFQGGKLVGRSWQSKQMPSAVLQTETADGKVTMRLLNYRRGGRDPWFEW